MEERIYTVTIHPAAEGGYWAEVPALPGCFTQGESLEEVMARVKEAIEGFVECLAAHGQPIPLEKHHPQRSTLNIQVRTLARA